MSIALVTVTFSENNLLLATTTMTIRFFKRLSIYGVIILLSVLTPHFVYAQQPNNQKIDPVLQLMEQARLALTNKDFDTAIKIYGKIFSKNNAHYSPLALEFTGVAREKKGQLAHAKAAYEQYLKKYPLNNSAHRVRQRLLALITAANKPKQKLRQIKKLKPGREYEWSLFGGLSQYYRYADLSIKDSVSNQKTSIDIESSLSTDLYWSLRGQNSQWNTQLRIGMGYLNDFLPDSSNDDRLSELFIDIENRNSRHTLRLGRQRGHGSGVLGRFDGIVTKFELSEKHQLHLIHGYPVESTNDVKLNKNKKVYGINLDLGPYWSSWEFTPFLVEQRSEGFIDRRATGFETHYYNNGKSLFTLIDYDIYFSTLNTLLAIGSWRMSDATSLNATIDLRKSPALTTSNALQGQLETTLERLNQLFTEEEIKQIAQDRTAKSTLISTGVNHKLSERWTIYSSLTLTKLSKIPASAGVEALPGTANEWSYNMQLISTGLIKENDTGIFSLRYFDGTSSQRTSFDIDIRYPVNQNFRISPRFRVDLRTSTKDDTDQWVYRPSIKSSYRLKRKYHFEIEFGGEWSTRELSATNKEKTQGLFGMIGYRVDL